MQQIDVKGIKKETVADYVASKQAVEFCKANRLKARSNPDLPTGYCKLIHNILLNGVTVTDPITNKSEVRHFDYSESYIRQALSPVNTIYNHWVVKVALEYKQNPLDSISATISIPQTA